MPLRDYQANAVDAGTTLIRSNSKKNGIIVIPTAGGKSHVIGAMADDIDDAALILQPSKEILEQNFKKIIMTGQTDVGIYSASLNSKAIRKITLATIGSIHRKPELFKEFKWIGVDECDLVNAKQGMYKDFFEAVKVPIVGYTATPWRLQKGYQTGTRRIGSKVIPEYSGAVNKILTRTRPRVFSDIIHITQIGDLYDQGFLCPLNYVEGYFEQGQLTLNSTGNDYTEASLKRISSNIIDDAVKAVRDTKAKSHLVFARFIDEAEKISEKLNNIGISCAVVTGETPKDERESIISAFTSGRLGALINVGVLTVGFDYPGLDHIVLARALNSARLYYQILGRGIRIHEDKKLCTLTDLCGNVDRLGKIENWKIEDKDGNKMYRLFNGNAPLTGIDLKSGKDLENSNNNSQTGNKIHFGKFKGKTMQEVPHTYLRWVVANFSPGSFKNQAKDELTRRKLAHV